MELLGGHDLKAALKDRRFSLTEAPDVIHQAAESLATGHRAGIVHGDIKRGNLLVADRGSGWNVRILDFGISKALEFEADDALTLPGGGLPSHLPNSERQVRLLDRNPKFISLVSSRTSSSRANLRLRRSNEISLPAVKRSR